jgi:hypothetical protein
MGRNIFPKSCEVDVLLNTYRDNLLDISSTTQTSQVFAMNQQWCSAVETQRESTNQCGSHPTLHTQFTLLIYFGFQITTNLNINVTSGSKSAYSNYSIP